MDKLFRNKVLIRTSPSSPFFLIPIALLNRHPPSNVNIIDLQIMCCNLSKTYRLACLLYAEFIFVIFQRIQSDSAEQAVEEIIRLFPAVDVGAEEEVKSASLTAKAIEWGFRFNMFDNGWSSIGENFFVQSTFACSEERKHLCAINVEVQAETDGGIVFLVSPDVIWFKRHRISDFASSGFENFENGSKVTLDVHAIPVNCTVLPSLHEGLVIGISKVLPDRETLNRYEELLTLKNGISLSSSYFLNIQFNSRGHINMEWHPSAFVMHGSGLSPAPHSIRTTKAMHILNHFICLIEGWDFFSQGPLKVKEVSSLGTSTMTPVWTTATSTLNSFTVRDNISYGRINNGKNDILSYHNLTLDYRMPKPPFGCVLASKEKQPNVLKIITPSDKVAFDIQSKSTHDTDIIKPIFAKRGLKSKTKCKIASSVTEIKLKSKKGSLSKLAVKESGIVSARNVAEKKFFCENVEIKATKGKRNAESRNIIGNEMVQKSTSSEAILNESTAENTQIAVTATMHDSIIAQIGLTSVEDCMISVTTTKTNPATESNLAEIIHPSSESCVDKASLQPGVCKQKIEECMQPNQISGNKEEVEASMQIQSSTDSKIVKPVEVLIAKTSDNGRKIKEAASSACKKMKSKPFIDAADIVDKVLDCHNRGVLQTLTVPELKSFLTTKKAKVGGKKEDLIQRINTILSAFQ